MNHILITALISGLLQMVLHGFPWRLVLGRDLPRVPAYVLGVLGFLLPLTVLFLQIDLGLGQHLVALWACVVSSGLAVTGAYALDWVASRVRSSYEHEELNNAKAGREQ